MALHAAAKAGAPAAASEASTSRAVRAGCGGVPVAAVCARRTWTAKGGGQVQLVEQEGVWGDRLKSGGEDESAAWRG